MAINIGRLFTLVVSFTVCLIAFSVNSARAQDNIEPVVVRADKVEALLGAYPDDIRMFSWSGGAWQAIPYQIDERMEVSAYKSWTRRTQIMTYAFDSGAKAKPDPDPTLDRDDELCFMVSSAAGKAPQGGGPQGSSVCEEIVIMKRNGESAFAYACSMSSVTRTSERKFVALITDEEISTTGYEVSYPIGNPVNFESLRARANGGLLPDVVDRMKLKVDVEVGLGIASYPLTDSDYEHFIRGVKTGPIRIIKEYETVLETWGGVQFRSYNHVYFYPYHIEYNMLARGAANWGKSFNRSHLIMAIDLDNSGRGMTFYSEKNLRGEMVDGKSETSELYMDYGPTEWSAVSGKAGTIMVHMGLDRFTELYKDLYYADNDAKGDPPEDYPGTIGKFGYIVRNMQKAGFDPFPVRFAVWPTDREYEKGLEEDFVKMYSEPLPVEVNRHELFALSPDAPLVEDTREEPPKSAFAEQERSFLQARFVLPNLIIDPELLGSGPGVSYVDIDFLGTGTYFDTGFLFTERGYFSYWMTISELRFIKAVESFRVSASFGSFPAEPFYGVGNDSDKDENTLYWWRKNEANVTFKKYFGGIYGADFKIGYREISIDSGIEPVSGEGTPSIEEHYGKDDELVGERWGLPVYGMKGGNHNGINVELYRDMRDAKYLPKHGNYQEIEVHWVSSAFGADYDYANVKIDLRAYWHPDFLNPIPFLDTNVNPRRDFLEKFFGPDKNRAIAVRLQAAKLFAEEIEYEGREVLDVPFYELNYLGSSSTLKGYSSKRFRDNDMVVGSIEYRWRWWRFEDVAVFYDIGMVMDDLFVRDHYEDQEWHQGYGFSYRIHVPPHVIVTFEYGWSVEEQAHLHQMNVAF